MEIKKVLKLNNIPLKQKMMVSFGLVILLMAIIGYIGYSGINSVNHDIEHIVTEHASAAVIANEMSTASEMSMRGVSSYLAGEEDGKAMFEEGLADMKVSQEQLDTLLDEPEDRETLATISTMMVDFEETGYSLMDAHDQNVIQRDTGMGMMEGADAAGEPFMELAKEKGDTTALDLVWAQAMAFNDYLITGEAEEKDNFDEIGAEIKALDNYEDYREFYEEFEPAGLAVFEQYGLYLEADAAEKVAYSEFESDSEQLTSELATLTESQEAQINEVSEEAYADSNNALYLLVILLVGAMLVAVAAGVYISNNITSSVGKMLDATKKIADGDLTITLDDESTDELGQLSEAINSMGGRLRSLVGQIQTASYTMTRQLQGNSSEMETMAAASEQIFESISLIVKGTNNQSSRTEEVSHAMSDMTGTIQEIATNAQQAAVDANNANNLAEEIGSTSRELSAMMQRIEQAVGNSANVISDLDEKSMRIGEIVSLITNIADQTNLLALNAAIEAARAGEHGRGFAVVADEVRKLAEDSGSAAQQIADLIHEIQEGTEHAVSSMKNGTDEVATGVASIEQTSGAIGDIVSSIAGVTIMIQDIAAAAEEQSASIEEITSAIEEVADISNQSAAGSECVSDAINDQNKGVQGFAVSIKALAEKADELEKATSMFQIEERL
ncbi:methyl-accepting chemotaxis protein [Methanolobus vulcani]|nr:methyl-accepting chemotaxis protein [Methanolobus vulcani]